MLAAVVPAAPLGDAFVPGPAPFVATGLFFLGMGAAGGAWWLFARRARGHRAAVAGLVAFACCCFVVGTAVPFLYGARPALGRPATTGRLEILSPRPGELFRGDPATIPVRLRLEGATIVPISSLRLVPNEGHIHLSLDGALISMTSQLETSVTASPGRHRLRAEFVAVDHAPFDPRVIATVAFSVQG